MGDSLTMDNLIISDHHHTTNLVDIDDCNNDNDNNNNNNIQPKLDERLLPSPSLKAPSSLNNSIQSSSLSSSLANSPTAKFTARLRKFKGKPSIIDEPKLVELCEIFTNSKNISGLALIARQRGLPPHMRHKIWPLLLKSHPFLIKPYITPDEDEDLEEDEIDLENKIEHDLKRYFKRSHNHIDVNERHQMNKKENIINHVESKDSLKLEDELIKVMKYSILKFLKKWGSLINYNSGLSWVALGLAEWVPPLASNEEYSNYVLCGREVVNKNGGSCLRKIDDEVDDYLAYSSSFCSSNNNNNNNNNNNTSDDDHNYSPSSIISMDQPIYNDDDKENKSDSIEIENLSDTSSTITTNSTTTTQQLPTIFPMHKSSTIGNNGSTNVNNNLGGGKNLSFSEIYERMVLVILHSPKPSEDISPSHFDKDEDDNLHHTVSNMDDQEHEHEHEEEEEEEEETLKDKIMTTLPIKGGTSEERLSFFLYCLRRLLPELAQFFTDEDILNTTSVKDDWVVWWLKWCGAKVWSKYDRGRIWDMLLGWRSFDDIGNKDELNDLLIDENILQLLGPDIFWHPLTFGKDDDICSEEQTNFDEHPNHHHRHNHNHHHHNRHEQQHKDKKDGSSSIKTLITSLSSTNLSSSMVNPTEDNDNLMELKEKIPCSSLNPHTEIVFISLSFIKSKEFALLELEQSEIREFLNKASSTKLDGFQNLFEDEINSNDNNNNNKTNNDEKLGNNKITNKNELMVDEVVVNVKANGNNDNDENTDKNNEQQEQQQDIDEDCLKDGEVDNDNKTKKNDDNGGDVISDRKIHKRKLRDIENIIVESGELWRKWIWQEAVD